MKMKFPHLLLCVLCTLFFSAQAQQYDPGAGSTNLLIGQTFQSEYQDYINGTGLTPAGSSHYATFFLGAIEQGDDQPNSQFLDWVRSNQSNPYALVALSFKDNTEAGGYGQMTDNSQPLNANAVWDALKDVTSGAWDAEIDDFSQIMSSRSDTRFYLRIGYEVSLLLFAYNNGSQYVNDWLTQQANAGINVFDDPDAVAEMDRQAYIDAYNYIANRIRNVNGVTNVDFVYHPVRGLNDTRWLYPGSQFVDWVAFSIFNNDVCVEVNGTFNCQGQSIDPQLQQSIDFAKQQGHPIMIAESAVQAPASSTSGEFIDYLNRLHDVVVDNDVRVLAYINSNWPIHGWGPEWGDSRVEENTSVRNHWMSVFGTGTRYIHSGGTAPTPTCTDGIQNGDETGVDCGGSCPNSCPTVPTCTDGIQNGDETGVDCGGSCPNSCPTTGGGNCGEFGITYVNNTTGIIYHRDNNYRANFNFLCLDGDCRPGTLEDGYYKRTVTVSLNQTYNVEFKVDDASGQVIVNDQFTFTTAACSFTGGGTTPTCTDGIQNGDETGVDCGGSCPNSCPTTPTCTDGIQNGDETGVDCGGSCPNSCPTTPTCTDGIQNGDETGVDCGGSCPNSCPTTGGGNCGEFGITYVNNTTGIIYHRDNNYRANFNFLCLDGDCRPGTLEDGYYKRTVTVSLNQTYNVEFKVDDASGQVIVNDQFTFTTATCSFTGGGTTPTCTDGIQNGDETGVDCGGSCPNSCPTVPTCTDGIQNGDETGVDCGGSCPNNCPTTPTCTDGIQNGDETGVDCGGSCPNNCPTPPTGNFISGKFTPKNGRTFLTIGQDLGSVDGYVNSGLFPDPAGVTMYTDVYEMAGLTDIVNYGAGDVGLQEALNRNPNSALAVGLWMVEDANQNNGNGRPFPNGLTELVNGQHDNDLDAFAAFANNNATRPIFLRIGYEFDGPWNGYDAGRYIAAYQYIVDYLNGKGVTNIAYVWQSATWGATAPNIIDSYYPGDAYVDYVGLSFFFFDENFNGDNLQYTLDFARNKNIPIMMAEVSAQYYEFDQGTFHPFDNPGSPVQLGGEGIWNQYFVDQLLPFIKSNNDVIRHVAYINADWQSQDLWRWAGCR